MEAFLLDFGKSLVEKLLNKGIEKSRYIFCFSCIAKEFDEEKVNLDAELAAMKQRFKVATKNDKDILPNALLWEKQAGDLIHEDKEKQPRCLFELCPNCIWRYKRGEEMETKIKEIKILVEKRERLGNFEIARILPDIERYSSQYYISFKSREFKFKELSDALKEDSNYITGLHGMGGTGKTTLAKEVGKQLKLSKQFDHVIYTIVSFTPDIKKIQDDIAGSLGLDLKDINESDRPKRLWSRLTNGEKILVILDDVWEYLNYGHIGIPYSDQSIGCKVLVTTRYQWVCNKMACGKTIQLDLISEDDAWTMFHMHANLSSISSKSILDKGRKIATQCKRLPVAIATIASSLKGQKRRQEWDFALTSLQKPLSTGGIGDDLVDIYKCLKFSYDYLKDENAKGLFLLCSTFQEDEEISMEILTRLGIGVGLFGEVYEKYNDARSQADRAKNKLLDSCLLLETKKGDVKMHDLVREVAQWIANKEIITVNFSNQNQKSLVERDKSIKYFLFQGNLIDLFSTRFDGSMLEILIVNMDKCDSADIPVSFFESIARLRALHLLNKSFNWIMMMKSKLTLPQSIRSLTNIRSLIVENLNLGDISVLGSLQSLETLDLTYCFIYELPWEITKLKKFRLLNLERCKIRRSNPFEVIQGCSSLEELYFCDSFNKFCQEITLPTLQIYRINDASDIMNDSLSKCVSIHDNYFLEPTFKKVMQTSQLLRFRGIMKGWRNLMPEIIPIYQGMNDLTELCLESNPQLQCLVDTTGSQETIVFSNLVVLILEEMENLEELCNGPISFDSLNNLEELSIDSCQRLRSLFKCSLNLCNLKTVTLKSCSALVSVFELSTSRTLLLLEKLEIVDCEQLEKIFTYERRMDDKIEEILVDDNSKSCNSMFPKLKVVNIQTCSQLQFIFPLFSAKDILLLESITVQHCDKLKYIFGQYQDVELASLKELTLHDLPNFVNIFPESPHSISKPQTQSEPIKSNTFSWSHICCPGYKLKGTTNTQISLASEDQPQDCSISMVSNCVAQCLSRSISHIVCNIKVIELVNLSKIKSVFMLSIAPKMLLESLTIKNCDELEHIIIDIGDGSCGGNIVFPNLNELKVENCEKLEYIFGQINASGDHQDHNLHLPSLKCLKLYNLPNLIGMCTENHRTTLPSLTEVELSECSKVDIKSFGDLSVSNCSISITQESTTMIKQLSGNIEHFLALKRLVLNNNSKIESIFCLTESNKQQMKLGLEDIELHVLPMMTRLFVDPKRIISLENLARLKIGQCEKLEIVFSTSIIGCLPHLLYIRIEECKELKHVIEDDLENKNMSDLVSRKAFFPKLKTFVVVKCSKLKCVFPASTCKEFSELENLIIKEADELEEIFKSEGDYKKVKIPNLNVVALFNLPSLCKVQGIQFQAVRNRIVQNCPKLSLASASTPISSLEMYQLDFSLDDELFINLRNQFEHLQEELASEETPQGFATEIEAVDLGDSPETSMTDYQKQGLLTEMKNLLDEFSEELGGYSTDNEIEAQYFGYEIEAQVASGHELTFSHELMSEQSIMDQQHPLGEIMETIEGKREFVVDIPGLVIPLVESSEELMNQQSPSHECLMDQQIGSPTQKGIKLCFEDITTLANANTITLPISTTEPLTIEDVDSGESHETTQTNNQVSLNRDASMKVSSNIEEQISKDDGKVRFSKSRSSTSITSTIASQFSSTLSKGDTSQIVKDLGSSLLVTRELEQLVSEKHLVYENMSLLTDFFVKHPSILLKDTLLSNRYKGYAYNCLAELLKFLQTHSALDVLGSRHSEFVELVQDVRKFSFDKDWLDGVERRALFPDLQFSQDALRKLLDSKKQVIKDVEEMRLKIYFFNQHVEDLKHQLSFSEAGLVSIIQQEAQVLETKAALSAPLGY